MALSCSWHARRPSSRGACRLPRETSFDQGVLANDLLKPSRGRGPLRSGMNRFGDNNRRGRAFRKWLMRHILAGFGFNFESLNKGVERQRAEILA